MSRLNEWVNRSCFIDENDSTQFCFPGLLGAIQCKGLGLTAQHAWQLAHNSFAASFIDASAKRVLQDRLAEVFETFD